MRTPFALSLCLGALLLVTACQIIPSAAPTKYQAASKNRGMGYAHEVLAPNLYRISFTATGATGADQIQGFTLKRAAELAQAAGYDYVRLLRSDVTVTPTQGRKVTYKRTIQMPTLEDAPPCTMTGCGNDMRMFRSTVTDAQVSATDMNIVVHSIEIEMLNENPEDNFFAVKTLLQML